MKLAYTFTMIALSTALLACGLTDFAGTVGTCTYTSAASSICTDYTYAGKMKEDPKATATTQAQAACTANSGTFAADATCSRTGATGICVIPSTVTSGSETFTFTGTIVFPDSINVATGTATCTSSSGTYTAL